ncbi:DDE superfamily endonuclease [Hirsutella rhossiliensis]
MHFKALGRPKLTPEVAEKRLLFAIRHINLPLGAWKSWVFSDETSIAQGEGERQAWVFCKYGERLQEANVQPRGKPKRNTQMFWGAFCYHTRTSLIALPGDPAAARGGVTGRVIQVCLEETLPTILEPGYTFIQDNAPVHTSRAVQNWLRDFLRENGVAPVDWPPYSPDLNPIENLWKLLKERICFGR